MAQDAADDLVEFVWAYGFCHVSFSNLQFSSLSEGGIAKYVILNRY